MGLSDENQANPSERDEPFLKQLFRSLALAGLLLALCLRASAASFLVISDTHMRAHTDAFDAALEAVADAAQDRSCLLMLGDSTDNGQAEEHALAVQRARELVQRTGATVLMIPGNHDYSSHYGPEDFRAQYAAFGTDLAFSRDTVSASCAVMADGGVCLLLLDTNRRDGASSVLPDGGIAEETLAWAESVLAGLPAGTPVIACGHHPILPASRDQRTPGAAALAGLLRRCGVSLYLCGHDHGFATVTEEGLRQITVGQPQAYPGWAGLLTREETAFRWQTVRLYSEDSPAWRLLRASSETLAAAMARGTLAGTAHEGDETAIRWFSDVFMAHVSGELTPERCAALLAEDGSRLWREIETKTVVKTWIFSLLEHCPEQAQRLDIPLRRAE